MYDEATEQYITFDAAMEQVHKMEGATEGEAAAGGQPAGEEGSPQAPSQAGPEGAGQSGDAEGR